MILAGDADGTKTVLAIYFKDNSRLIEQVSERFNSKEYSSLDEIISQFCNKYNTKISKACIGIHGPVIDGKSTSTNLPWLLDENILSIKLNIPKFKLINDLVATAAAMPHLSNEELITLHKGNNRENRTDTYVILAPGTGLGQAVLYYTNGHYHIIASEGGHCDFAPSNETEIELLKYLQKKFKHVSYERVLSGQGLINIFNFLKDTGYEKIDNAFLLRLQKNDPAAEISKAGLAAENKLCVKALDIFTSVLGAQAGNLVLTLISTGGVYIGGGIPPKLINKLIDGTILNSYLNKGRLSYLTESTPMYLIKITSAPLIGAAYQASVL